MKGQVIAELLAEYAQERMQAEQAAAKIHAQVAEKAPLYGQLGAQLARIMAESVTSGEDAAQKVYELRDAAHTQLAQAGFTPEDLVPAYRCSTCRDTAFVLGENGQKVHCTCYGPRLREKLIARSGLSSGPGHCFDHFDLLIFSDEAAEGLSQRETMKRLLAYAREYCEAFPQNPRRDLTLTGETGLGKTFLADCMAARIMERGFGVLRLTAFRMMEAMRRYHMGRDEENMLEIMLNADLLLIDDLGTEPLLDNISVEYLFTVLNERQQAKRGTIVATNLTPAELRARYTERITSRLFNQECAAVVRLSGKDVRLNRQGGEK